MKTQNGFTLIELMVVLAIIGIIATVAIPSYERNVQKSARGNSMNELLDVMRAQEDYSANNLTYSTSLVALSYSDPYIVDSDKYSVTAGTCGDGTTISTCVRLTAAPINGQRGGSLTLNSRGEKTQNGESGWKK